MPSLADTMRRLPVAVVLLGTVLAAPAMGQAIRERGTDTLEAPEGAIELPKRIQIEVTTGDDTSRAIVIQGRASRTASDSTAIVRMGEDVIVHENQVIDGDVVSIGGNVKVLGRVMGDAVSVGGNIELRGHAVVEGDAVSIGGTVKKDPGARIGGQNIGMRFIPSAVLSIARPRDGHPLLAFLGMSVLLVFLFFVGWLLTVLADRRLRRMGAYVEDHLWKSLLTGLAVLILFPAAFILLLVTVVGIPLALLLPVALPLAQLIGFLVVSGVVGIRLLKQEASARANWVAAIASGLILFLGIPLLGQIARAAGGAVAFFGTVLVVFGLAAAYISSTIGLGGVILSRFGQPRRDRESLVTPTGPPPPGQSPHSATA